MVAVQTIAKFLELAEGKWQEKQALTFIHVDMGYERSYTYGELAKRVRQTATFLCEKGVSAGSRIALSLSNAPEIIILEMAAGLLGASSVPLDIERDTLERKIFKLQNTSPKVFFGNDTEETRNLQTRFQETTFVLFHGSSAFEHIVENQQEYRDDANGLSLEHEYLVLYTSGTTAHPKGVSLSLRSCFANAHGIIDWQHFSSEDRFSVILPLHHINSTIFSLATLLAGGTVILSSRYSVSRFWSVITDHKVTCTSVVPTVLHDLLSRKDEYFLGAYDTTSLKRILVGSAPVLPEETLKFMDVFGVKVVQGYGQTETALRVTGVPVDLPEQEHRRMVKENSIGKELLHSQVKIVREDGSLVSEGEEGEICIAGPILAHGYVNNEAETNNVFCDGWFYSGDIGSFIVKDGVRFFFVKGRKKEIIIKGGINISPTAIEDALLQSYPEIHEVCVVGYPDNRMGEDVAAIILLKTSLTEHKQQELVRQVLADGKEGSIKGITRFESPSRVIIAALEFPKTSTGKVQRVLVKDMFNAVSCRIIGPQEHDIIKEAVAINNERWSVQSSKEEFCNRARNGYLLGVFCGGVLEGSLSLLRVSGSFLQHAFSWDEVTGKGLFETHNANGDVLLCAAISVRSKNQDNTKSTSYVPPHVLALAPLVVEEYVETNLDNAIRFHRKPKGGFNEGARVIKILSQGRPEDMEALGYNVLLEYPQITKNTSLEKSNNGNPSTALIEEAFVLAQKIGCERVVAFSRPAQLLLHLRKALDESIHFSPREQADFKRFSDKVKEACKRVS